ncbi:RsfA family transcriptional regulator [Alteribacter natronophilus]|uniref:RsfA family transcriptional regulator n=1 Tax=Alteribacter natronophilus TaxID=2583810 RepID=UPI00110E49BD|nr:RsfA family transcriptional regulator [Alteribacter natronophilus]TMW73112.1 RsfA family transcriptional regulator [Alteribacter natronophilus]
MVRQDAWNNDEDLTLAETVLRHIRDGSTQLAAFEEVGRRLSRTPAACGFRWNSAIRKKYETAIQLAKKQRKAVKGKKGHVENGVDYPRSVNSGGESAPKGIVGVFDEVIAFLHEQREKLESAGAAEDANELAEAVAALRQENEVLSKELNKVKGDYDIMKQDYQLMINVVERAAKRNKNTADNLS